MNTGVYMQHGELRRIALEMALDRFRNRTDDDGEDIIALAESFYLFLVGAS